jgi:hypothetical protein
VLHIQTPVGTMMLASSSNGVLFEKAHAIAPAFTPSGPTLAMARLGS